jgi:hypothetical protein
MRAEIFSPTVHSKGGESYDAWAQRRRCYRPHRSRRACVPGDSRELGVWLIGDSRRWAAAAITLLGVTTCGLGSPSKGKATKFLATLGILAFVFAALALATASLTPLSLLVVDIGVLWAMSTLRHIVQVARKPLPT